MPTVPDSGDAVQMDRDRLTLRATGQPVTGREEDVVDRGSEVEPHASVTSQHHNAESVRGVA